MTTAVQDKREAQIKKWSAELTKLEASIDEAIADAKIKTEQERKELEEKKSSFRAKLEDYRRAGEQASDDLRDGVEESWKSLKSAFDDAKSRFD